MKPQRDEAILSKGTQTVGGRAGREVKLTIYTTNHHSKSDSRDTAHTQAAQGFRAVWGQRRVSATACQRSPESVWSGRAS